MSAGTFLFPQQGVEGRGRHVENFAFHDSRPVFGELVGRTLCSSFDPAGQERGLGVLVFGGGGRGLGRLGRMETPESFSKLMKFFFCNLHKIVLVRCTGSEWLPGSETVYKNMAQQQLPNTFQN